LRVEGRKGERCEGGKSPFDAELSLYDRTCFELGPGRKRENVERRGA